jgi:TadE-like protein
VLVSPIFRRFTLLLSPSDIVMIFKNRQRYNRARHRRFVECSGSVAVEFAIAAPAVIVIAAGIVDFGMLATETTALAAAARIGAEYARLYPLDTGGIQQSMQSAVSFGRTLTFPASFPQSCECDDATPITCGESCATVGRPGPNHVFISISVSQAFTPLVPWPGIPETLTATTEVRVQ